MASSHEIIAANNLRADRERARFVTGHDFARAEQEGFVTGHDFSRAAVEKVL